MSRAHKPLFPLLQDVTSALPFFLSSPKDLDLTPSTGSRSCKDRLHRLGHHWIHTTGFRISSLHMYMSIGSSIAPWSVATRSAILGSYLLWDDPGWSCSLDTQLIHMCCSGNIFAWASSTPPGLDLLPGGSLRLLPITGQSRKRLLWSQVSLSRPANHRFDGSEDDVWDMLSFSLPSRTSADASRRTHHGGRITAKSLTMLT
jgi:hypothetical protein